MRNPYIGKGRTELRNAMMRLKGADIYTPRAAVQIDDAFKATEAAMPQGMQASYKQQRDESLSKLDSNFRSDMSGIRSNQEYGDLIVDNIADQRQTLSNSEEAGLSALIDTIVTGGMGNRMADQRGLQQRLENTFADAKKAVDYNNANKKAFIDAGVPANRYNDEIGLIREGDKGKVPKYGRFLDTGLENITSAPYVSPDGSTRVHTEYVNNPVTGVPQIVPMMDTEQPGKALSIKYGEYVPGKHNLASEVTQKHILKLMGANPTQYAGKNGRSVGSTDFQGTIDGELQNIDGMIRDVTGDKANTVNIPLYVNIRPKGQFIPAGDEGNDSVKRKVYGKLSGYINDNNTSIEQAVERLKTQSRNGLEGPPEMDEQIGKVLRSDKSFVGEGDHYDKLINTGYDASDGVINKRDDYVSAPSTVHLIDLLTARNVGNSKSGAEAQGRLMVTSNKNGGLPPHMRDQAKNAKVQEVFNMNDTYKGKAFAIDVLKDPKYAAVHQALRDLKYI